MPISNLPLQLTDPVDIDGKVASKIMLDLTAYLLGPSESELEYLVSWYEDICPRDRLMKYKISEFDYWVKLDRPELTASGRAAASAGTDRPYLEPVRRRIRDGRAFEVGLWDGRPIDDPDESWSFSCRRIHLRSTGLHAFVRILIPLKDSPEILRRAARAIADHVELYSGHGGVAFVYDPWLKPDAFDAIYAQSRRFWGVDVEDLNDTLPLMKEGIKGVNWITMLGPRLAPEDSADKISAALAEITTIPDVTMERRKHAAVLTLGAQPVAGDQHRPDHSLDPYYNTAGALKSLFLKEHPDFPSERWVQNGNTVGWIRRFIEPDGWR